jgi:predicted O-methyltransferase YrrM
MTTLTTSPLAPLLDRLFAEADSVTSTVLTSVSAKERDRLMHSKTEYLSLYGRLKDLWLPVSRDTGALLYMLARTSKAQNIVEFGTSFGLSTLHMAAALRDNGGGKLITSEFEPSKVQRARAHFVEGGVADLVEVREGDALKTLAVSLPEKIDLLVLDGAKALYDDILDLLEPMCVRRRTVICRFRSAMTLRCRYVSAKDAAAVRLQKHARRPNSRA